MVEQGRRSTDGSIRGIISGGTSLRGDANGRVFVVQWGRDGFYYTGIRAHEREKLSWVFGGRDLAEVRCSFPLTH